MGRTVQENLLSKSLKCISFKPQKRIFLNNISPLKCWTFPFCFFHIWQPPASESFAFVPRFLYLFVFTASCLPKKKPRQWEVYSRVWPSGYTLTFMGQLALTTQQELYVAVWKLIFAPAFTVGDCRWTLTWETNQMLFREVDFRVMWAQLNIADSRIHGPRVVWGQCAVRWLGQRQQAIVCIFPMSESASGVKYFTTIMTWVQCV